MIYTIESWLSRKKVEDRVTGQEAGGRDAQRSLELLWGGGKRPGRRARPALSLHRIVEAAIELADAEGLGALSMQRLAERLGFSTMALYRYVPGKAELIDVMVDAACGEPPELGWADGGWREKLELWARESYGLFVRHPWMLQVVTSRRLMGPNELAWFDSGLSAVTGIGLTGEEMIEVLILVNAYVRGLAQALVDVAVAERDTGVSERRWYSAYEPLLKRFDREERYPALRDILEEGAFDESDEGSGPDDAVEFGLQRVLDGIESFVLARATQSESR
jgi:AcrR family transcriptional regulator